MYKKVAMPIFVDGYKENTEIHIIYQVSPQCIVWFARLRCEVVEKCLRPFLLPWKH